MKIFELFSGGRSPKDDFARRVKRRLEERGWSGPSPLYIREPYSIRLGAENTLFLDNAFAAWSRSQGRNREQQIELLIGHLFDPPREAGFASSAPRLLPVLRNRSHIANLWMKPGLEHTRGVYEGAMQPLGEDLVVLIAEDSETAMALVTSERLGAWGLSFADALETAVENLRSISPCRFVRDPGGFWISDYGDHYDASRLLLPHVFEQLELKGRPVAVPLDRAAVLVAGAEDPAALTAMAAFAEAKAPEVERPISCAPLILAGGLWSSFAFKDHGLPPLERLRLLQSLRDHSEQKSLLDAHHRASGQDVFVPKTSTAMEHDRWHTWAVWPDELELLLPRTDVIAFVKGAGEQMEHRPRYWGDVEAIVGPLTAEPDLHPPRYRLQGWPESLWEAVGPLPGPQWGRPDAKTEPNPPA